jgi:hypothetical protein
MKTIRYKDKKASLKRAMKALYREIGPVEMMRVTSIGHEVREDSVTRHRKLQASLDDEQCIKEILDEYRKK